MKKQTTLEAFTIDNSETLRRKVKEILQKREQLFVKKYFKDYFNSEVVIEDDG